MDLSDKLSNVKISPQTSPLWQGEYSHIGLRRKLDMILKKDAEGMKLQHLRQDNVQRIIQFRSHPDICMEFEQCKKELLVPAAAADDVTLLVKSTEMSNKLRQEGNDFYKRKQLSMAHKGFTLSLCYAIENSREMILAHSNRSACSMEMNHLEECLQDIEKALMGIDTLEDNLSTNVELSSVKGKLIERKLKCFAKKASTDSQNNHDSNSSKQVEYPVEGEIKKYMQFFKLKSPSNCIDSAEEFLRIQDSLSRGRHVIVTKDVRPGTVIILEEPYSKVLVKQFKWETKFCHRCFKDITFMTSMPCYKCVFAVYCSESCLLLDKSLHDFDCKMSNYLHKLSLKRLVLLAYRTLIKLGSEELYKFWKNGFPQNAASILGFDSIGKYTSSTYYPINCLIYHDKSLTEYELRQYCLDAIMITDLLNEKTNFFRSVMNENDKDYQSFMDFASSLILLHQMNFPCNAHSLNVLQFPNKCPTTEEIRLATTTDFGAAAFPLLSMINHSCDPNVTRTTLSNGMNAVVTIKTIKSGAEILDNYGAHFALEDYSDRQRHLLQNYNFKCNCVACHNNWSTVDGLQNEENTFVCLSCSKDIQPEEYRKTCEILRSNSKCIKCKQAWNLESLTTDLKLYVKSFEEGYQLVLKNHPYEALEILVKCLEYFDSHLVSPFITSNFTQETLKQALNLMGMYCLSHDCLIKNERK